MRDEAREKEKEREAGLKNGKRERRKKRKGNEEKKKIGERE
jgi:hypothetical protein